MPNTINQITTHIHTLAGDIGERNVFHPQALASAANYIKEEWERQGYDVDSQHYRAKGVDCANLEVTRAGCDVTEPAILIGAHYDSVKGSPGANDNGSGVAALLELSRLFSSINPKTTIRFVAFVNEEPPFFFRKQMGSMIYAKKSKKCQDKIRFMVSLETIGYYQDYAGSQSYPPVIKWFYPDRGNFIAFVSNLRSRNIMHQAADVFRQRSSFLLQCIATFSWIPGISWSDHMAFWRNGYHAFMITDTAFYRYPYYHTAQDTPDKIHYQHLATLTESLFNTFSIMTH